MRSKSVIRNLQRITHLQEFLLEYRTRRYQTRSRYQSQCRDVIVIVQLFAQIKCFLARETRYVNISK